MKLFFLFPKETIFSRYRAQRQMREEIFHVMENKTVFDNIKPLSCGKVISAVQER